MSVSRAAEELDKDAVVAKEYEFAHGQKPGARRENCRRAQVLVT